MDDLTTLRRRIQTLESMVADLVEQVSSYQTGTDRNPHNYIYLNDSSGDGVAKVDFNASAGTLRVTKVR